MYIYELNTPTDRAQFYEPNNICFIIFGHLHENLLFVLLDYLLKLAIVGGHYLHQLILYMHAMMMQPFSI